MAGDAVLQEAAIEETGTAAGRTIDSIAVVGENVEALAQETSDTSMAVGQRLSVG